MSLSRFYLALLFVVPSLSCGTDTADNEPAVSKTQQALTSTDPMNTSISGYIQIDQLPTPAVSPEDANLFRGNYPRLVDPATMADDPADDTKSRDYPVTSKTGDIYIDWNDLDTAGKGNGLAEHRLRDLDDPATKGKDPNSFPTSDACVGSSSVLSKMDLTYVAAANNREFVYLAVQRSDNNGDAGYYWLFTKIEPTLSAPCGTNGKWLEYTISKNDVLIKGHFHPGDEPLLEVFVAKGTAFGSGGAGGAGGTGGTSGTSPTFKRDANQAIKYTDGTLWVKDPTGVAAVAVNTTPTRAGILGLDGVKALSGTVNVQHEIFAEAAVPLATFTGGTSTCGATFYGSVITRPSGSGGPNPDLKDLAGPALFNFGGLDASASLTPSCAAAFGYTANGSVSDGSNTNIACAWTFSKGGSTSITQTGCTGTLAVDAGTYTGSVTVTDSVSGCDDAVENLTVNVYDPLEASLTLTPDCNLSFTYDGDGAKGSGSYRYDWTFAGNEAGAGTPTPASAANDEAGTVTVDVGNKFYRADLTVTDLRTDLSGCTATAWGQTKPFGKLGVTLGASDTLLQCPMDADAITFTATPSGGNGDYIYTWPSGTGCPTTQAYCTYNPDDSDMCYDATARVVLSDTSGLCSNQSSTGFDMKKRTTVTATAVP